jgi:uncharacterized protein YecA (UPF0149 family)
MVRVPIDDRRWAIWNRYCQAAGVSMGRGIAGLIEEELASVVTGTSEEIASPLVIEAQKNLATQQAALAAVEERLAGEVTRLQQWERQLEYRRDELHRLELRIRAPAPTRSSTSAIVRVGRNDPCPCGSGAKYKRCHGG